MSDTIPFLDTNILIRFLVNDVPQQAAECRKLVDALANGTQHAWTSHFVIAEAEFTLSKYYKLDRVRIAEMLSIIISLRGLKIDEKRIFERVFQLYLDHPSVDYADCYHAALAASRGCSRVLSYDKHFDRFSDLARVEPGDLLGG
jgi:predicted nucleic acid-binding protein